MAFPKSLMRSTYRALLKRSTAFDESTACRVLLTAAPTRVYMHQNQAWMDTPPSAEWNAAWQTVDHYVRKANRGMELYLPPIEPSDEVTLRSLIRESYRSRPLTSASMNEAFSAVKLFANAAERAAFLPTEPPKLASSASSSASGFELVAGPVPAEGAEAEEEEEPWDLDGRVRGRVIVAHPLLPGIFNQSIVCLIPNLAKPADPSDSSMTGFIINRPLTNDHGVVVPVWAALPRDLHDLFTDHLSKNAVMIGGPISNIMSRQAAVFVVHRIAEAPQAVAVAPGLWASFHRDGYDYLAERMAADKLDAADFMVVTGYAGWGRTQLHGEVRSGSWLVADRWLSAIDKDARGRKVEEVPALTSEDTSIADFLLGCNAVVAEDQLVTNQPTEAWSALVQSWGSRYTDLTRLAAISEEPRGSSRHSE
jgi:putative AlgH/UPF0301 family transcriptional regulator